MADEPTVDEEQENIPADKWKPALKTGLALIAVVIFFFIFYVFKSVLLSGYLRPWWISWQVYDTGRYPLYDAMDLLLDGAMLTVLACLLVTNKSWHETLFDELQLKISRRAMNYFAGGLIIGAFAVIALDLVTMLSDTYLFKGFLDIGFRSDRLAVAALLMIPLLVESIGSVVLIQGYFQRTISKNYGGVAGIIVAAFISMIVSIFPHLAWLLAPQYLVDYFLTGVVIASLFYLSKSVYMSIGFVFASALFSRIYGVFTSVYWGVSIPTFLGVSESLIAYLIKVLMLALVLALIWYFGYRSPGELSKLTGRLKNVVTTVLSRIGD